MTSKPEKVEPATFIDADITHKCKSCRREEDVAMFMGEKGEWIYFEDDATGCPTCGGLLRIEEDN